MENKTISGSPKVSIVTPSFNQAAFLEDAMRSVLSQGYPDIEYMVLDGGSTDGSKIVLDKYKDRLAYYRSAPDGGQADAINTGWSMSSGEILGWLNSDDMLAEGAIHKIASAFASNPGVKVVYGDCDVVDMSGKPKGGKRPLNFSRRTLLMSRSLPQPSVYISKEVFRELGGLDTSLYYALDWAYFLKIFWRYKDSDFLYIPEVLSMSREYGGTKSRKGTYKKGAERRDVLRRYFDEGVLPGSASQMKDKAVASTYRLQAADSFLAGDYPGAFYSLFKAICLVPSASLLGPGKIGRFIKKRIEILNESE